jgi:hypothetical protein
MTESTDSRVGTHVLLETDDLRVWEMVLEPGESSGVHRHRHDYLFVYTTEENLLEVRVPGQAPLAVRAGHGYVANTQVGDGSSEQLEHELVNVGTSRHRQIVVELLGASGEGRAVTVNNGRGVDLWAEKGGAGV